MLEIYQQDNLEWLKYQKSNTFDLIFIDPPFSTQKQQTLKRMKTVQDENGTKVGFGGKKYKTEIISETSYNDKFDNFKDFIYPRMKECYRILKETGSLFFMIDDRESHYCKIWLDEIFGRENYKNELIWAFDFGGKSKQKWSRKHNVIFWFTKSDTYTFNYDQIDRIPYMSGEGIVSKEKLERGKIPTDCWEINDGDYWWNSIVGTNSKERQRGNGYPTQKSLKILNRIIKVHTNEGDLICDFFAGSGTTGESCLINNRNCILVDNNQLAIDVMEKRFKDYKDVNFIFA